MALFQSISIDQLFKTWAADGGPTEDEKNQYADAASELLDDDEMVAQFTANVEKVGTWANDVDASFDKVNRTFADMVDKYGGSFPGLSNFKNDWTGYTNVRSFISLSDFTLIDVFMSIALGRPPKSLSRCRIRARCDS